jgi:hypothetical protein
LKRGKNGEVCAIDFASYVVLNKDTQENLSTFDIEEDKDVSNEHRATIFYCNAKSY